jgi:hypothetical protein
VTSLEFTGPSARYFLSSEYIAQRDLVRFTPEEPTKAQLAKLAKRLDKKQRQVHDRTREKE